MANWESGKEKISNMRLTYIVGLLFLLMIISFLGLRLINLTVLESRLQDSVGIVFDSLEQARQLTRLIVDMQNNMRLWINYGHTPQESGALKRSPDFSANRPTLLPVPGNQPLRSPKVGRNDPCPCGRGKKFKKCCGIRNEG